MIDIGPTPPSDAAARHERPFTRARGRWDRARTRTLRSGPVGGRRSSAAGDSMLVYERTRWGWLAWPVPQDGSTPELPQQIGVLTPTATRTHRLALRWLTRRPARRITVPFGCAVQVRRATVVIALISLAAGLAATACGLAVGVALPAMLLAPLLTGHIPDRLDDRARECVRSVEDAGAVRHLQPLAALQSRLVQATASSGRHEVRRSAEVGQHVLWDAADLLQTRDVREAAADLAARERLLVQLADQVAHILHTPAEGTPPPQRRSCHPGMSAGRLLRKHVTTHLKRHH